MAARTRIEWCDHTWSPWIGCTPVSAACDHCYAAAMAHRRGWAEFAAGAPRHRTSKDYWKQPLAWNRRAAANGVRESVFPSLCDPFDAEVSDAWRDDAFDLAERTPSLDWLILTKRPKVARSYFSGSRKVPRNVRLGITAENQKMLELRAKEIIEIPAALLPFLSAEPLLGPLDARQWLHDYGCGCGWGGQPLDYCNECGWRGEAPGEVGEAECPECKRPLADYNACPECDGHDGDGMSFGPNHAWIGWVIAGGESGPHARPSHPDWFRALRGQCQAAGVPFFFKQWGEWRGYAPTEEKPAGKWRDWNGGHVSARVGKKAAGAELDGREWREFPT